MAACRTPGETRALLRRARGPVVIRGVISGWPALSRWTPATLAARRGDLPVTYTSEPRARDVTRLASWQRRRKVRASFAEFVVAMTDAQGPLAFLLLSDLLTRVPELGADVAPLDGCIPSRPGRALKPPVLWIGPDGLVSPLHFDQEHNLFAQILGRKEWLLYPPSARRDLYVPWPEHPEPLLHWSPVDVAAPDLARFPRFARLVPFRHVVEPGDLLYVPAGWWHGVTYVGHSISLSQFWTDLDGVVACRAHHAALWRRRLLGALGLSRLVPRLEAASLR